MVRQPIQQHACQPLQAEHFGPLGLRCVTVGGRVQLLLERSGVMRKDLRHSASEHHAEATESGTRRPSRILFLGGSYSPLSVACLQTLVDLQHHIVVGRCDPWTKGVWRLIRERSRSRGWFFVLAKLRI
jgi:hypothetical protein